MGRAKSAYAKLTRPRLHGAVIRAQLFSALDQARARGQAIFCLAPAGAGKTTLLTSWLDARGIGGIWYQVAPDDHDVATFFHYLTEAARRFARKGTRPLPVPTPEHLQDIAGFARHFFRELYRRMPPSSALVLDNYQDAPAQSELHQLMSCALEELPQTHVLAVLSRHDAPPQHSRFLANERVRVMTWEDLRLSVQEAGEIVRRKCSADDNLIRRLHEQCGGWAAGLTLLLERSRVDQGHVEDVLRMDAVFDYFNAEIFHSLPESIREFLMATAYLPYVAVTIAEELTGNADAKEILERFHRRNLFTDRILGREATYQYHAMFRQFLLQRGEDLLDPPTRRHFATKAASLLVRLRDWDTAVVLYCSLEAWEQLILLVVEHAAELLSQGRWRTLQGWVGSLPPHERDRNPWVRYWSGVSLAAVDVMKARDELEEAFNLFRHRDDVLGQMLTASEILRAFFVEFRSFERVDPWIDTLSELVSRNFAVPEAGMELRIYSGLLGALVSRRTKHPLVERCVQRTQALLEHQSDPNLVLTAGISLCFYASMCGRIDLAEDVAAMVRPHLQLNSVSPVLRVFWTGSYGYVRYIAGDSSAALQLFEEAERLSDKNELGARINFIRAWHAYCLRRVARIDEAESIGRQIEEAATDSGSRRNVVWLRALNERSRGALANAVRLGAEALGGDKPSECTLHGAQQLQQAEMLLEAGLPDLALPWLAQAKDQILGTFSESPWQPVIGLLEAFIALKQGDQIRCHAMLRQALGSLAGERTLVFVRWFPCTLRHVLPVAFAAGINPAIATKLVQECGITGQRGYPREWPWPVRIYTLGRFEVELKGERLTFGKKIPRRLITLLKAIVAFGSREVSEHKLIDALWPDELGDAATHALVMAIHRLRRLLGLAQALQIADGKVHLDETLVWTDVEQFERDITQSHDLETLHRAIDLYGGEFLRDESESAWAASLRERLRMKLLYHIEQTGVRLESMSRHSEAAPLYIRGLESDPLCETFYQGLMRCYAAQDRRPEALSAYRRMRQQLSIVLGVPPSRSSEALARQLRLS